MGLDVSIQGCHNPKWRLLQCLYSAPAQVHSAGGSHEACKVHGSRWRGHLSALWQSKALLLTEEL